MMIYFMKDLRRVDRVCPSWCCPCLSCAVGPTRSVLYFHLIVKGSDIFDGMEYDHKDTVHL